MVVVVATLATKDSARSPSWMADITSWKISAGYEPPVTSRSVVGGSMGIWASGKPTHTAVVYCGV